MKIQLLSVGLLCSVALSAQHANFQQIFYQLEELPGFYNEFMEEYTYDVNRNLNQSFFYNLQSNAEVMDTGEFSVGLLFGGGRIAPPNVVTSSSSPLYNNDNLSFMSNVPTVFNIYEATDIRFVFLDPNNGNELVNPQTGETLEFYLATPGSLGTNEILVGSAALSLGYGIGYGTEVRGYITPKFGAALGAVDEGFSATNDFAYGLSVKHEISTWIPYLQTRGWHVSADFAYSAFTAGVRGDFLSDLNSNISVDVTEDYEVFATSNIEGIDYSIATTGGRFFIGKTFSWIEFSLYAGYMTNSYKVNSVGSISATLRDNSGNNPDSNIELDDFVNFEGSNTSFFYGASSTIGKGWARWTLGLTYTEGVYASSGINFYL